MGTIEILTTDTFEAAIADQSPLLIEFYADSCVNCRAAEPILRRLAAEFAETLRVAKVDVMANLDLKTRYDVKAGPTLLMFARGELRARLNGIVDERQYREAILGLLGPSVADVA